MDVPRFLTLPIDVRKHVYWFLGSRFLDVEQELAVQDDENWRWEQDSVVNLQFYKLFRPYLKIFEYSKSGTLKWQAYSLWMRYDALVLDCLRLNHLFEGTLISKSGMDWIYLDSKPRVAIFDTNGMLQVWFTMKEYKKFVADVDDTIDITYLRLSMEYINETQLKFFIDGTRKKNVLNEINEVCFYDADEDDIGDSETLKSAGQLDNKSAIQIVQTMDQMKKLASVMATGDNFYLTLINPQGTRDNPGKMINHSSRKRIMKIRLERLTSMTAVRLADFTRWDNLRELVLCHIETVDLNGLILPSRCKKLTIENVTNLKWWELQEIFKTLISTTESLPLWKLHTAIRNLTIHTLNNETMNKELITNAQIHVKSRLAPLKYIKVQNITNPIQERIIVTSNLLKNRNIMLYQLNSHPTNVYAI